MSDIKVKSSIPDGDYLAMLLKLSHQLSSASDMEALKHMVKRCIPDGKRERLDTPLQVFDFLENLELVGPRNLCLLLELLEKMEKHELCAIVASFIEIMETGE